MIRSLARYLAALLVGVLAGSVVTLGVLVARARFAGRFLHSLGEGPGWPVLPALLLPLLLTLWAAKAGRLATATTGALAGLVLGAGAVGLGGQVLGAETVEVWARGAMAAAAGVLGGGLLGALAGGGGDDRPEGRPTAGLFRVAAALTVAALVVGTGVALATGRDPEPLPTVGVAPDPAPEAVESVVFFLGDPGQATSDGYPVLPRLAAEVERWAGGVGRDSAVAVVVLGDVVYPVGLREPGTDEHGRDSTIVADQVALVSGPAAVEHHARMLFVAGNHDWGRKENVEGARRLENLERFLETRRADGLAVSLLPDAGTGGPGVVDLGTRLRLVLLDTAWWLLDAEAPAKEAMADSLEGALRHAAGRQVILAAHHPFVSAGPHGGRGTPGAGWIRALLSRSGVLLQDIHSRPYRELRSALLTAFEATGPPLLFAGGHEHSLQVIRGTEPHGPAWNAVIGSASKLTSVGGHPAMEFGRSAPGYGRLFVLRDGTLRLDLVAAPARYLACPEGESDRSRCMTEGVGAYRTVWSGRLRTGE